VIPELLGQQLIRVIPELLGQQLIRVIQVLVYLEIQG
jgi:hypothetical protein